MPKQVTQEPEAEEIIQLKQIMREKSELLKMQFGGNKVIKFHDHEKLPAYTPVYRRSVELNEKIRPHAEDNYFPEKMFERKAPNEKPEEFIYRKHIFKIIGPVTYPFWAKAMSTVNRIWNEHNYSIKYPEITEEPYTKYSPQKYFEEDFPDYVSIEDQFKTIITNDKLSDPNSWAVVDVKPLENPSDIPEPYVRLFQSANIIGFEEKKWLLCLTPEKSEVLVGSVEKKEGLVLRYYDRNSIFRVYQYGKKEDYNFNIEIFYEHGLGELFADRLKGSPRREDDVVYYESYFQPAISSLNEALLDASNLQISKIIHVFPEYWEYVDECNEPGCDHGTIWDDDREHGRRCNTCGGTGVKNWASPMAAIQVQVPKMNTPMGIDTANLKLPPKEYISKTGEVTEILKFLRSEVSSRAIEAFQMLNIDVSNSQVKGSDTALGRMIDREELFSFLLNISNELFSLLEFMINGCGRMRYDTAQGKKWTKVEIGRPTNFAIRNNTELTEEIIKAKESQLPPTIINHMLHEFINTRFNSRADVERLTGFMFRVDRLAAMSDIQVQAGISTGTVAKWEKILHDSISYFIAAALTDNPKFWELEFEQQEEIILNMAMEKAEEVAPQRMQMEDFLKTEEIEKEDE